LIEVRREVVSVIQPMEMVEIRFMNERVSPTGPEKKKRTLAAKLVEIKTYSHGVHENAK
jgi:hypothetical protein